MILFLLLWSGLGHKHSGKTLTEYSLGLALIAALVGSTAFPAPVLAYEASLPVASSQALVAKVQLAGDEQIPDSFSSNSAVAYPSVMTEKGNWPKARTKLALAEQLKTSKQQVSPVVLEGEASYYSRTGCLGCSASLTMANGQPLNDNALTMAIGADRKHLVGHEATVTNLVTGQQVKVRITDTGGFYKARYGNRVADLTIATKQAIGMKGGVGQVRVEVH